MKKFLLFIFVIVILTVVGMATFVAYNYIQEKNSLRFDRISSPDSNATSTIDVNSASSTDRYVSYNVDTASWKTYTNDELGFSLKYPSNLTVNYGSRSFILAFSKKLYFHWPLEDSVILTVIASSTCASQTIRSDYETISTSTIINNNQKYFLSEGSGIATGNIYKKSVYDITGNETCYSIVIDSRGANGAGLYVDDPVLIKKYDDQHTNDVDALTNIIYGIISTFNILSTPEGQIES